jgi:hypothetical protein
MGNFEVELLLLSPKLVPFNDRAEAVYVAFPIRQRLR